MLNPNVGNKRQKKQNKKAMDVVIDLLTKVGSEVTVLNLEPDHVSKEISSLVDAMITTSQQDVKLNTSKHEKYERYLSILEIAEDLIKQLPDQHQQDKERHLRSINRVKKAIYKQTPSLQWMRSIDNYDVFKEEREKAIKEGNNYQEKNPSEVINSLLGEQGKQVLHEGIEFESKSAREQFLIYLEQQLKSKNNNSNKKPRETIDMQTLLGSEGVKLYEAAIKEEANSRAFREAVFLKSTQNFEGEKWSKKLVLWIGGPSGAGKSFAAKETVKALSSNMPKKLFDDDGSGNNVVTIDGGFEREVSQIRQLTLQVALSKGHKGIQDLHSHTKLDTKKHVKAATLTQPDLSLVIPETFVESMLSLKRLDKEGAYKENEMLQYHQMDGVIQVFAEVKCQEGLEESFQNTVHHMGNSRAWQKEEDTFEESDIEVNNRSIGCESKEYDGSGFYWGEVASGYARENFQKMNPEGHYIKITNDLIYVRNVGAYSWKECTKDQNDGMKISRRDFEEWNRQNQQRNNVPDLKEWYDQLQEDKQQAKLLIDISTTQSEPKKTSKETDSLLPKLPKKDSRKTLMFKTYTSETPSGVISMTLREKNTNQQPDPEPSTDSSDDSKDEKKRKMDKS